MDMVMLHCLACEKAFAVNRDAIGVDEAFACPLYDREVDVEEDTAEQTQAYKSGRIEHPVQPEQTILFCGKSPEQVVRGRNRFGHGRTGAGVSILETGPRQGQEFNLVPPRCRSAPPFSDSTV